MTSYYIQKHMISWVIFHLKGKLKGIFFPNCIKYMCHLSYQIPTFY